ncbi:hypothetical protein ACFE04_003260 [Oxalis oulophora]
MAPPPQQQPQQGINKTRFEKSTSLGFDMQSVGKDLAYTLRNETMFQNPVDDVVHKPVVENILEENLDESKNEDDVFEEAIGTDEHVAENGVKPESVTFHGADKKGEIIEAIGDSDSVLVKDNAHGGEIIENAHIEENKFEETSEENTEEETEKRVIDEQLTGDNELIREVVTEKEVVVNDQLNNGEDGVDLKSEKQVDNSENKKIQPVSDATSSYTPRSETMFGNFWNNKATSGLSVNLLIPVGRTTNLIARANMNNRGAVQISVRLNTCEQLQICLIALIPILRKLFGRYARVNSCYMSWRLCYDRKIACETGDR